MSESFRQMKLRQTTGLPSVFRLECVHWCSRRLLDSHFTAAKKSRNKKREAARESRRYTVGQRNTKPHVRLRETESPTSLPKRKSLHQTNRSIHQKNSANALKKMKATKANRENTKKVAEPLNKELVDAKRKDCGVGCDYSKSQVQVTQT
ncbi:hypothetical protein M3Y96_00479800 [Aphelenchoides besseyi]|nr:hypothetical protein M3Y96_00479800 [Aphelenchoides besseyi]